MSKLDDILPCSCGFEPSDDQHYPECPKTVKAEVQTLVLELIEQSKDHMLPLTWLTKQIEEL